MTFLSDDQLNEVGFAAVGANVFVSTRSSIYGASRIHLGSNVRIDDFCILSAGVGGIFIGSHVHVAAYSSIIGAGRVDISDFANISSRVGIYSSSDDYSGRFMTNPMVPDQFKSVDTRPVSVGRHVVIGSGTVVLPGSAIGDGASIGALSLVSRDLDEWGIYAGVPARRIKGRSRALLEREREFLDEIGKSV